eukprot:GHVS01064526.1.p1 GENE.GHVS01064526.1~~GHVS01064526.1.p1  ORF type:complete len:457 (+),score=38.15 GHVS01064526.1:1618-2988(+)
MEVKAAEFVKSTTFSFGWTLRFATVVRACRSDLSWTDAWNIDTLTDFREKSLQLSQQSNQPPSHCGDMEADNDSEDQSSKDEVGKEPMADVPTPVHQRKRTRTGLTGQSMHSNSGPLLLEAFRQIDTTDVAVKSQVFCCCEILVVDAVSEGHDGLRKADLERLVVEYGGGVTQAFRRSLTTHVVATGESFRTRKIVEMYGVAVLRGTWLSSCVMANRLLPLCPRYLINCTPKLESRFKEEFSSYGCPFFQSSDAEELREICCNRRHAFETLSAGPDCQEARQMCLDAGVLERSTRCSELKVYVGHTAAVTMVAERYSEGAGEAKDAAAERAMRHGRCLLSEKRREAVDKEMEQAIDRSTDLRDQSTLLRFQMLGGRLAGVVDDDITHILCQGDEQPERVIAQVPDRGTQERLCAYARCSAGQNLPCVSCSWLRSRMDGNEVVSSAVTFLNLINSSD